MLCTINNALWLSCTKEPSTNRTSSKQMLAKPWRDQPGEASFFSMRIWPSRQLSHRTSDIIPKQASTEGVRNLAS